MRKSLFLIVALTVMVGSAQAQQDTIKTLVHLPKLNAIGLYIAPEFQYGQSNAEFTSYAGGSAMLLLNNRFAVGVTGQYGIDENFAPKGVSPLTLQSGYGGLKMEYTLNPASAVHITFPLVVGMGGARADSLGSRDHDHYMHNDSTDENNEREDRMSGDFLVIQPGIQVEANLFKYAKLFAGVNYRIAPSIGSASTLPTNSLQGFGINVGLKVGLFNYHFRDRRKKVEKM